MLSNYPPGAEHDPNAPWNEISVPEKEFEVTISQTLSKNVIVYTDNYIPDVDYETGYVYADTSETDWKEVCKEQHYTIPELLEHLQVFAEKELENVSPNSGKGRELQNIIDACENWVVDDYEAVYY